jgi:hypothetical protein
VAIEVTQDLPKLTLEYAGGRLRAAKDRVVEDDALPPPRLDCKLLLTEEQWKEKMCQCSNAGQGSSGGGEQRRRLRKATVGRRERSVMTSVTIAGAPVIGPEIAANQKRSRSI